MVPDTDGVVVVVVVCVPPAPAPVSPAVEPAVDPAPVVSPAFADVVVLVPVVVLELLPGVVTVALPVVGIVSGGAPDVLVRLALLLPLPQAAKTAPAANAAIRANIRERVGIERDLRT